MPSTLLFAINNEGRVFGLSTNGTKWREFIYLGLEFKQLSAVPNFLWAVGGDRQIYVHAHGLDIPIRVKEIAFENERWTPFDGFSKRLLPTDRYNFSNQDGTVDRSLKKIRLPSMAWQWEGDWKLELTLDGQPLDHDGWTYAVDFPATYYPTKQWTSCVRRRKWVRYRRYIALNSWCAIAPLHKNPTREPFIGVSVGGNQLPGGKVGTMLVWAVTAYGRVMFRTEVSNLSPEGQRWSSVPMPSGCEVSQVSVGAAGLVWVVLWNGKALVRTGITRDCVTGNAWSEVEQPGDNLPLNQVSIGCNGVWAITRDSRVWFRKGIQGESSGVSESLAKGTGWVEMCGSMANISVASNDQVWAVGAEDRTSVTQEDLMGKTWRAIGAPTQLSRAGSSMSLMSGGVEGTPREKRHRSWASLNRHSGSHENHSGVDFNETCHSAPAVARNLWHKTTDVASSSSVSSVQSSNSDSLGTSLQNSSCNMSETNTHFKESQEEKIEDVKEYSDAHDGDNEGFSNAYENVSRPVCGFLSKEVAVPTCSWSPQHAGGTVVAAEAHYAADSIVFESDELTGIYSEHGEREDEDDHLYWADSEAFWSTVEAGACLVNVNYLPNWFTDISTSKKIELVKPWRIKILNELKRRIPSNLEGLENYEKAIDSSTWVKAGNCKCFLSNELTCRDCIIELEWVTAENDYLDCGTLTLCNLKKTELWAQINLREVTAVISCSIPRSPRLALFYNSSSTPLKLQFGAEDEYEEWKSELSSVCCRIRNIVGIPRSDSIWITTGLGDIYVCDPSHIEMEQRITNTDDYSIELTFTGCDMPIEVPLLEGFLPGSFIVISGCIHDNAKRFSIDFVCREENGNCNIAFHFNPRFDEGVVVQNIKNGSNWGKEKRSSCQPFNMGNSFEIKIVSERNVFTVFVDGKKFVDYSTEEIVERESTASFITHLNCGGDINVNKILYSTKNVIIQPTLMFWRQIEGHLRKVETAGGVTWGIGFDNTAWLYSGSESSSTHMMHDTHFYYVYENQRWNPLTGYTSHGLPTDRFMWSDVTGKHKRTREKTILLSKKWHWINEWSIDFHTPGGVDNEGWQYAVDFPSSYHGRKYLTDYVRRRRWFRCAKLETEGPWVELGFTPLSDCSLCTDGTEIMAWAVASNGYVLYRRGVSRACPAGLSWEHVASDEQMISISCGPKHVWAVGKSGAAFCRIGISPNNPLGECWETIEAPVGTSLKQVSVGNSGIWALDACGRISARKEVSSVFPLGSHWRTLPLLSYEQSIKDDWGLPSTPVTSGSSGFRQVAAKNKLWAVTSSGRLACRLCLNLENPTGSLWLFGIEANFLHTSS